ncbi:MAG: CPBP family intramembrane glutamic endopeptidase [Syntrophomonadaceae bacterium]|jgi:membrane protease YdiL (CAAX protease family)
MKNRNAQIERPQWGLLEISAVYIGILAAGLLFGSFSDVIKSWLTGIGIDNIAIAYFIIVYFFQFIVTLLLVLVFTMVFNQASLSDLGLRHTTWVNYLRYGISGGFLLMVIIMGLGLIMNYFNPEIKPQPFEEMLREASSISFIFLLVIGAVLAPISEELYYRGMVYPVFRFYMGPLGGAIVAGLIFGLVHWDLWRAIPLAAGGAILCYIYEKSGSILVSAVAHGTWNGIMALIVCLTSSG